MKDIFSMDAGAMPEQVKELVNALIEGRVRQLALIVETTEGTVMDCFQIIESNANRFTMVGAIEILKRDYLRAQVQSRVEYQEKTDEDE
jgi:hypothetical protein